MEIKGFTPGTIFLKPVSNGNAAGNYANQREGVIKYAGAEWPAKFGYPNRDREGEIGIQQG